MRHASVTDAKLRSPLHEAMRVVPSSNGRGKRKMVTALILTSLVDAFSIMLLYLLCQNTGNGSTLELNRAEKLPTAIRAEALTDGTQLRVEGGHYFLNNQMVEKNDIAGRLQQVHASVVGKPDADSLIIQADRTVDFAMLAPIIRAGSLTGFNKFKFAVIQEEESQL